ncbi:5900_t:CDS:1, partial [Paraglomus brasilianum]
MNDNIFAFNFHLPPLCSSRLHLHDHPPPRTRGTLGKFLVLINILFKLLISSFAFKTSVSFSLSPYGAYEYALRDTYFANAVNEAVYSVERGS